VPEIGGKGEESRRPATGRRPNVAPPPGGGRERAFFLRANLLSVSRNPLLATHEPLPLSSPCVGNGPPGHWLRRVHFPLPAWGGQGHGNGGQVWFWCFPPLAWGAGACGETFETAKNSPLPAQKAPRWSSQKAPSCPACRSRGGPAASSEAPLLPVGLFAPFPLFARGGSLREEAPRGWVGSSRRPASPLLARLLARGDALDASFAGRRPG
jgi:hypothetical protein